MKEIICRLFGWMWSIFAQSIALFQSKKEIEKKWIVPTRTLSLEVLMTGIPRVHETCFIEQTYLTSPYRLGVECRVRKITYPDASCAYVYTEKTDTRTHGARREFECSVSPEDYASLIRSRRDTACMPVVKLRYTFTYVDPHIGEVKGELDVYQECLEGLVTLEVEVSRASQLTTIAPPIFCSHAVEAISACGNHQLAKYGITDELREIMNQ